MAYQTPMGFLTPMGCPKPMNSDICKVSNDNSSPRSFDGDSVLHKTSRDVVRPRSMIDDNEDWGQQQQGEVRNWVELDLSPDTPQSSWFLARKPTFYQLEDMYQYLGTWGCPPCKQAQDSLYQAKAVVFVPGLFVPTSQPSSTRASSAPVAATSQRDVVMPGPRKHQCASEGPVLMEPLPNTAATRNAGSTPRTVQREIGDANRKSSLRQTCKPAEPSLTAPTATREDADSSEYKSGKNDGHNKNGGQRRQRRLRRPRRRRPVVADSPQMVLIAPGLHLLRAPSAENLQLQALCWLGSAMTSWVARLGHGSEV
ncbi:hypothetical protein Hte_008685 [Hypoxylon texense]